MARAELETAPKRYRYRGQVKPGWFVKVLVKAGKGSEAFWLRIKAVDGKKIRGIVANKLLLSSHGYKYGQQVTFTKDKIRKLVKSNPVAASSTTPKVENPPPAGTLPAKAKRMLSEVYESARNEGDGQEKAGRKAWSTVGRYYYRKGGKWRKRKTPLQRNAYPPKYGAPNPADLEDKPKKRNSRKTKKAKPSRQPSPNSTPTLSGRKLKRNPIPLRDLATAADLGHVLELVAGGKRISFDERKKPAMLYNPSARALFLHIGGKESKRRKLKENDKTAKAIRTWTNGRRGARDERQAEIPDAVFKNVERIGKAASIAYRSDKFKARGNPDDYEHKFGPGVSLYKFGGKKPPWVFVVRGGRMRVTNRGIVG